MKTRLLSLLLVLLMLLSLCACGASAPEIYEVRFELNGGTLVSGELLQSVTAGSDAEAPKVEREGYTFMGWNTGLQAVSGNLVAAALWQKNEEPPAVFDVRFELNGGTLVSGELLQHVEAGSAAEAPVIEREGYSFSGWNRTFDAVTDDCIVVPLWEKTEQPPAVYEVRFELNGGTLVSGELLQRVEAGSAAEAPAVEREGYEFEGWDKALTDIEANTVAVARWSQSFRIVFDPAGGTPVSGELEQQVRRGELPAAPELELPYYAFAGWDPALAEAAGDTTYTALWSPRKLSSEEIYDKVSPAVIEIEADEPSGEYYSLGSGFFIDDCGRFVTNYHVIDGTILGQVTLTDGTVCDIVAVLDYDEALDLAILQADVTGNPFLRISEKTVATGETVYTLGSSEGLTGTFSAGIVSAASRVLDGVRCIQITAPISEGNSGGPLLDLYGEVVGVNAMTFISGQNLNFAIDIHELENLRQTGSLTLQEVFDIEYPDGIPDGWGDGEEGFYQDADYTENESNDSYELSDMLRSGKWIAGEISDADDLDWFCLVIEEPCEVEFLAAPYYEDDMDYLMAGIFKLNGKDTDIVDALDSVEEDDYVALSGTIRFDEAGTYFLVLCVDEDYPYETPAYYILRADW